ncbi:polynucleotide kinase 3'-phosphatase, putative [Babesia caballi]|uniref:Polynucleotide kinase 3'-phosphatase, putative n=1 Tax=Babesia caballi TaxID=5871 RepID=A0AAV4M121_BABCB|nr:polynucleotide kinase 3'-phosphatase, putative [Babesia caballi]
MATVDAELPPQWKQVRRMEHTHVDTQHDNVVYQRYGDPKPAERLAMFDMDSTLMLTPSTLVGDLVKGRRPSTNKPSVANDFILYNPNVREKLKAELDSGKAILVCSNQSQLFDNRKQSKLIFGPGMLAFYEEHLNEGIKVDRAGSFYVGDAAGRHWSKELLDANCKRVLALLQAADYSQKKYQCLDRYGQIKNVDGAAVVAKVKEGSLRQIFQRDFSDCDYKFALNCGVAFYTPEEYFCNLPRVPLSVAFDPKDIGANPVVLQVDEGMVILVGPPGSGKTFLCTHYLSNFVRIGQEVLRNGKSGMAKVREHLQKGESVVIDSTNPTAKERQEFIALARALAIKCTVVYLDVSAEFARHFHRHSKGEALGEVLGGRAQNAEAVVVGDLARLLGVGRLKHGVAEPAGNVADAPHGNAVGELLLLGAPLQVVEVLAGAPPHADAHRAVADVALHAASRAERLLHGLRQVVDAVGVGVHVPLAELEVEAAGRLQSLLLGRSQGVDQVLAPGVKLLLLRLLVGQVVDDVAVLLDELLGEHVVAHVDGHGEGVLKHHGHENDHLDSAGEVDQVGVAEGGEVVHHEQVAAETLGEEVANNAEQNLLQTRHFLSLLETAADADDGEQRVNVLLLHADVLPGGRGALLRGLSQREHAQNQTERLDQDRRLLLGLARDGKRDGEAVLTAEEVDHLGGGHQLPEAAQTGNQNVVQLRSVLLESQVGQKQTKYVELEQFLDASRGGGLSGEEVDAERHGDEVVADAAHRLDAELNTAAGEEPLAVLGVAAEGVQNVKEKQGDLAVLAVLGKHLEHGGKQHGKLAHVLLLVVHDKVGEGLQPDLQLHVREGGVQVGQPGAEALLDARVQEEDDIAGVESQVGNGLEEGLDAANGESLVGTGVRAQAAHERLGGAQLAVHALEVVVLVEHVAEQYAGAVGDFVDVGVLPQDAHVQLGALKLQEALRRLAVADAGVGQRQTGVGDDGVGGVCVAGVTVHEVYDAVEQSELADLGLDLLDHGHAAHEEEGVGNQVDVLGGGQNVLDAGDHVALYHQVEMALGDDLAQSAEDLAEQPRHLVLVGVVGVPDVDDGVDDVGAQVDAAVDGGALDQQHGVDEDDLDGALGALGGVRDDDVLARVHALEVAADEGHRGLAGQELGDQRRVEAAGAEGSRGRVGDVEVGLVGQTVHLEVQDAALDQVLAVVRAGVEQLKGHGAVNVVLAVLLLIREHLGAVLGHGLQQEVDVVGQLHGVGDGQSEALALALLEHEVDALAVADLGLVVGDALENLQHALLEGLVASLLGLHLEVVQQVHDGLHAGQDAPDALDLDGVLQQVAECHAAVGVGQQQVGPVLDELGQRLLEQGHSADRAGVDGGLQGLQYGHQRGLVDKRAVIQELREHLNGAHLVQILHVVLLVPAGHHSLGQETRVGAERLGGLALNHTGVEHLHNVLHRVLASGGVQAVHHAAHHGEVGQLALVGDLAEADALSGGESGAHGVGVGLVEAAGDQLADELHGRDDHLVGLLVVHHEVSGHGDHVDAPLLALGKDQPSAGVLGRRRCPGSGRAARRCEGAAPRPRPASSEDAVGVAEELDVAGAVLGVVDGNDLLQVARVRDGPGAELVLVVVEDRVAEPTGDQSGVGNEVLVVGGVRHAGVERSQELLGVSQSIGAVLEGRHEVHGQANAHGVDLLGHVLLLHLDGVDDAAHDGADLGLGTQEAEELAADSGDLLVVDVDHHDVADHLHYARALQRLLGLGVGEVQEQLQERQYSGGRVLVLVERLGDVRKHGGDVLAPAGNALAEVHEAGGRQGDELGVVGVKLNVTEERRHEPGFVGEELGDGLHGVQGHRGVTPFDEGHEVVAELDEVRALDQGLDAGGGDAHGGEALADAADDVGAVLEEREAAAYLA